MVTWIPQLVNSHEIITTNGYYYLKVGMKSILEAILMHDPVCLLAMRSTSNVKHQGLPHPYPAGSAEVVNGLVPPRGLPKPHPCSPVRPCPRRVLLVLMAEEIPLVLATRPDSTFICPHQFIISLASLYKHRKRVRLPLRSQGSSLLRSTSVMTSRSMASQDTFFLR